MRWNDSTPHRRRSNANWMLGLIWLLACLALTSCKTSMPRAQDAPAPEMLELLDPLPGPDPALTQPCPDELPPLQDGADKMAAQQLRDARQYHDCKDRHRALAEYERKRAQLERERIERAAKALKADWKDR